MSNQQLKALLKDRGVSQRALAERIGYTESYVYQAMNGHIDWNKRAVKLIAIELGLTDAEVCELFGPLQRVTVSPLPKGKGAA